MKKLIKIVLVVLPLLILIQALQPTKNLKVSASDYDDIAIITTNDEDFEGVGGLSLTETEM